MSTKDETQNISPTNNPLDFLKGIDTGFQEDELKSLTELAEIHEVVGRWRSLKETKNEFAEELGL